MNILASSGINIFKYGIVSVIALAIVVLTINVIVIMAFITFAAKKNSEMFDYDKMADKIAEKMIEKQIEYDDHINAERKKKMKIKTRTTQTKS